MLEQMGIANATALVEAQLAAQEIYLKIKTNEATLSIYDQITGLLNQGEASGIACSALFELCAQEEIFADTDLGVEEKIKELEKLALSFGIVSDTIVTASQLQEEVNLAKKMGATAEQIAELENKVLQGNYSKYQEAIQAKFADLSVSYTGNPYSGSSSSGSSTSTAKETKQAFDWTANSITNLQNKLDDLNTQLENTTGWKKQLAIQKEIIKAQQQLMQGYVSQADAYKKYYNEVSKGLTSKQKKMIESGTTFSVQTVGQETYDKLTKAQSAYQDWQEALKNVDNTLADISETADAIYNIPLEKVTEKVETFTDRIESLENKLSNADKVGDINDIYDRQRKNYTKIYQQYLDLESDSKKSLVKESRQLKQAMDDETKSTQAYIKERISSNKAIDTSKLKTTEAKLAAVEYNSALKASKEATKEVKSALAEYKQALQELAKSQIDEVIGYYDNRSSINSAKQDRIQSQMDITEAQGYSSGKKYYKKLISLSQSEIDRLEKEEAKLTDLMENGNLSEDAYYATLEHLYDIQNEIDKCKLNQIEWNKAIQQLEWDKFDTLIDKLSSITKESDFMISLYNEDDFYNEDGSLTADGLTVQSLHAQNYNTYLAQAEKYADEIRKINAELAKDPTNQLLIERRNELIEAQQDVILSAHAEKEAIIELTENVYRAQIEAMSELVDEKQKLLDKEKELHDYQKSIREQQTDITLLKKQIAALSLSTDRADIAKRLKLEEQLKKAEEQLAEDQYQHSIDTQKEALDDALAQYEEKTEEYLDDETKLFEDALDNINKHNSTVLENIRDKAQSVGYELSESIITIWSNTTPIDTYENAVIDSFTGIGTAIDNVTSKLDAMYKMYNQIAKVNVGNLVDEFNSYPSKGDATNSTADTAKIKSILGNASIKNGVLNEGTNVLNQYLASQGYGRVSGDKAVELAQALGLTDITSKDQLNKETRTAIIDALKEYLSSGDAVVDKLEKTGNVGIKKTQKIISLLNNASTYTKDRSNLHPLNQYIYDKYNKKYLNKNQMVELASIFGMDEVTDVSSINKSVKNKLLEKLKGAGFHDGGIIKKATGEDGIILANSGEAVLTKDEVVLFRSASEQLKTLQDAIKPVNYMVENMQLWQMNNTPTVTPVQRKMVGDVNVNSPMVVVQGNLDNVTHAELEQTMKRVPDYLMNSIKQFGSNF